MRLLNIRTQEFADFDGYSAPSYVITSHRWTSEEVSFKDFRKKRYSEDSKGYKKIQGFIASVEKDNEYLRSLDPNWLLSDWIWMDTCCIDQRSTSEVSESINSMFSWYSRANVCLAYLADVRPLAVGQEEVMDDFRRSEWFLRGWTLQELLAPSCVVFLNQIWEVIGHKCAYCVYRPTCVGLGPLLNEAVAEITAIPENVLGDYGQSETVTVRQKMKWMSNRRTTKIEDMAYSMLGIFNINMPLIYGEGSKAVIRLERKIHKEAARSVTNGVDMGEWFTPYHSAPDTEAGSTRSSFTKADAARPDMSEIWRLHTSVVTQPGNSGSSRSRKSPARRDSRHIATGGFPFDLAGSKLDDLATWSLRNHWQPSTRVSDDTSRLPLLDRVLELSQESRREIEIKSRVGILRNYECLHIGCALQGTKFKTEAQMMQHAEVVHGEKAFSMFRCNYPGCDFTTRNNSGIARHLRRHGPRDWRPRDPPSPPLRDDLSESDGSDVLDEIDSNFSDLEPEPLPSAPPSPFIRNSPETGGNAPAQLPFAPAKRSRRVMFTSVRSGEETTKASTKRSREDLHGVAGGVDIYR